MVRAEWERVIDDMVKVSVIVPIYNSENYLSYCLDSILESKMDDIEVICVNDGSTDGSLALLNKYKEKYNNFRVVSQVNKGCAEARNTGLSYAIGEYVSFIDSDDFVHPDYFKILYKCAKKYGADIVYCDREDVYSLDNITRKEIKEVSHRKIRSIYKDKKLRQFVWARIIKRDVISVKFNSKVGMYDDSFFNMELLNILNNPNIYYVNAKLYHYVIRQNSVSHVENNDRENLIKYVYDNLDIYQNNAILIMQMLKFSLYRRWYYSLIDDTDAIKTTNERLITFYNILKESKKFGRIELLSYKLLIKYPALYRRIRLHMDKTLYDLENRVKASCLKN